MPNNQPQQVGCNPIGCLFWIFMMLVLIAGIKWAWALAF
jgi:hypothetical protein